jgi:hypothetical protein
MPLFLFFSTHKQCILSRLCSKHNSNAMIPKKTYTLAGFEPGSSVPDVDAMPTAPHRHGILFDLLPICVTL